MTEKHQKERKVFLPSFALIGSSLATFFAAASCGVNVVPTSEVTKEIEKKVEEQLSKKYGETQTRLEKLEQAKEKEEKDKQKEAEATVIGATRSSSSVADSEAAYYTATRDLQIAGNLVRESSVSFAALQQAKEEFQQARDLYKEIILLEEQAEEEQRMIEEKTQEYRLARDNNWSVTSEVFLYLLTFKFIWGAFSSTGYAPTTFSSSQKAALEAQKTKAQTVLEEIKQKIFLVTRSFNNTLQRLERDLEFAYEAAVTIADQVVIKDIKKIARQLFKKYTEARKSYRDAFRVFRENLLAAANIPDITSEQKARMYRALAEEKEMEFALSQQSSDFLLQILGLAGASQTRRPKASPFTDSRTLARFQTFILRWEDMKVALKEYRDAKTVFEVEQEVILEGFEALFQTAQRRYSLLEVARKRQEKAKERANSKFGGARSRVSIKEIQKEVEEGLVVLNAKKKIFETLLEAQENSENVLSLFDEQTALLKQNLALTALEEIKEEEVALQKQGNGSFLREFALYTLGFKWLYASVYTLFYGMWKSEGKFDAFKPAAMSTEAEGEQSVLLAFTTPKKEQLLRDIELIKTELAKEKDKLTQTLEAIFELRDADVNRVTREATFDPRFRGTLQSIRVQLYEALTRQEQAQKEFEIAKARYTKYLRSSSINPTSDVFTWEQEPSYDSLSTDLFSPQLHHYLTQSISETGRVLPISDSVKANYKALRVSVFEREFRQAQAEFYSAKNYLENKITSFKETLNILLISMRNEVEAELTKQRRIEQELLINSAQEGLETNSTQESVPTEQQA